MKYQVGGSLRSDDPTYVTRQADERLYASLKSGNFCYVLNSRQMGKSSLLQRTSYRLREEGHSCVYLDMTRLGIEDTTSERWYKGIILSLFYSFNLAEQVNFKRWWEMQAGISSVQKLHLFVEGVLLPNVNSEHIFIFIDEIDSLLSLSFPINDFFAWIRQCYNLRSQNSNFERLGFALFGVASPSDLIADKRRTPFNLGKAIELQGFELHEAMPLLGGLESVVSQPQAILQEVIHWTGGQPFLTQKLCDLITYVASETPTGIITLPPGTEALWVKQLVKTYIIQNWQSQDEPEHLRTIRDRLLFNQQQAGRLLGIYQQVLQAESVEDMGTRRRGDAGMREDGDTGIQGRTDANTEDTNNSLRLLSPVPTDDSREQTELLLSGLVEKHNSYLKIKNPIYRHVFNSEWVVRQLDNLRPYSQTFNAWVISNYQDESRLLRGQALRDAQKWSQGKSLSDLDYQFFAASVECDRREVQTALEAARALEVEARLLQEKRTALLQRYLLVAVGIGLLISISLGIGTFTLYRQTQESETQARNSEIKALVSSSEGLFASNRHLDALVEAIKAKKRLQKLGITNINIERQVENVLRQAVYGADEYNRFSGHTAAVLAVDVSPDSSLIASASVDKTIKLWRRDGTEVATLKGHTATVRSIAFSPDGQRLASASEDGTLKLWQLNGEPALREGFPPQATGEPRRGQLLRTFKGHTASVWGVAWSPDGQFLASASFDTTVKLWKRDGKLLRTLQGYKQGFWGIAWSPDGEIVAAANLDKTVKLWKRDTSGWQNAKSLQPLLGHTGWVVGVAFSPDGKTIASSSEDKTVKLWQRDSKDGSYHQYKTLTGHSAGIWGVAFSPNGQTIASASLDKTIKLWNIDGTELRTLKAHTASVWGVTWSKDGSFIASAGTENVVRLWQSENPFQKSIIAHKVGIWSIAIASNSSTIATASHENTVKLWSRQGKLFKTLTEPGHIVFEVSFSKDGKLIAFGIDNDSVKLKKPDGTNVATYNDSQSKLLTAVLSPDGRTIAMANINKIVQIWHRDRSAPQILKGHQAEVWHIEFSPDGRFLGSASGDGTAKLWTLDGKLFSTLVGHSAAVWRVVFSPNSKMVATGSGDNTVKLWTLNGEPALREGFPLQATGEPRRGKLLKTFKGHSAAIWGVAFTPDGKILASGSVDATIKLWKLDGTEITTLKGHTAAIRELVISADGTLLASGGDDNTLILWNLQRILNLNALTYSCSLVQDYLKNNIAVEKDDRLLCNHS
ncbi:AAA-like domain-containing protein [Nostocaceae cyanobacterium CENA369]|uniref:AAA-like domain-containing protein n=1 Tax=Dendronalium phyllosphericum CENA369 TaxID=1725256 RepID=A0A8J7HX47_9NOST|nr:AAA-like domain-containing protein [Dendronalium phyllosphericum]MBH8571769.1 AAA-like domain-containing protein [Dendronalium phyllosphericum CENA369]